MVKGKSADRILVVLYNATGQIQHIRVGVLLLAAVFVFWINAFYATPVQAHGVMTPHTAEEWLAQEGLYSDEELCGSGYRIEGTELCSHGPDAAPPGFDLSQPVAPLDSLVQVSAILCEGDGVSGNRVQILYIREADKPDRYDEYVESIRQWASEMDEIFATSARMTGGYRRIRFVTDPDCHLDVPHVVVSSGGTNTFRATIIALVNLGYNKTGRKYAAFVDASVYCGIATVVSDSRPTPDNRSNHHTGYARVDNGCWSGAIAAHELVHNLGGVQPDAPNASGGWHCVDEFDLLCYSDEPFYPSMKYLCAIGYASLLDCNHDDYYHTNPPAGSYLATHWNVADSVFLIVGDLASNSAPTVDSLIYNSDATLIAPVTLTFTVEASDVDGAVSRVEFYEDANLSHTVNSPPYIFVWQEIGSGTYTITVKVYDDMEAVTASQPLSIVVSVSSDQQDNDEHQGAYRLYLPLVARP